MGSNKPWQAWRQEQPELLPEDTKVSDEIIYKKIEKKNQKVHNIILYIPNNF